MDQRRQAALPIAIAGLVLSAGLLIVGWYDYTSTRSELLTLLVDQAASMRQAVAAAASLGEAASTQTQAAMAARLLDNARLLRLLDARGGLTQAQLDEVARVNRLFRVTVLSPTGERELSSGTGGPPLGAGRGFGPGAGAGGGLGRGLGGGRGSRGAGADSAAGPGGGPGTMGALAERLLSGGEAEAVSDVHGSRWDRGWRLSAGVRRAKGGAIVLNVDASEIAELSRRASLDHLLQDIAARAPEIAYVVLEGGTNRIAYGPLAEATTVSTAPTGAAFRSVPIPQALEGLAAGELLVGSTPVLEFTGPVDAAREDSSTLRLGLNLDGLRRAERRTLTRLTLSLAAAFALGIVMFAFVGLRQQFGVLSEKHARAEEALRRRDRLAAMGELASTVAHEVRNPLNAIAMTAQRLRREFLGEDGARSAPDAAELRELLDVLTGETQRINRIVQQFLDYARPPRLSPRQVSLSALLEGVAESLRAQAGTRRITIATDVAGAGDAVLDPDQLKQAIDNLLRNAIDASPDGGRVRLEARHDAAGHVIEVIDEGPGIPAAVLPKIFDLYFTTKADGTGVGLAVTHQIVEAHHGRIDVESSPGTGTRMSVRIPAGQEAESDG
jgi:signal transduction histidine kinase